MFEIEKDPENPQLTPRAAASPPALGNPAVVGLAGFGFTTMLLQLHNLELIGADSVVWTGLIYGGLAQLIAGLQEFKTGNNFGYCAFTSYGAFWITLGLIFLGNHYDVYATDTEDLGYFLILWGAYSSIMFVAALTHHVAMAVTFLTLSLGFFVLGIGHIEGSDTVNKIAAVDLIVCALAAWYMMAAAIFKDAFGKEVLPLGKGSIFRQK